jgi:WD40 repeat protein
MTEQNSLNRFQRFDPLGKNVYFSANFSPDGQFIATGDKCRIKLWKPDGTLIKRWIGHTGAVYSVHFSPDGQILASGGADDTIKLWQRDGTLIKTLGTPNYEYGSHEYADAVTAIRFSPDGQIFASGNVNHTVKLWSRDGTLIKTLNEPPVYDQFNPINSLSFSPDGQTFVSCDRDGTIKLWSRDGTLIKTLIENSKDNEVGSSLRGVEFSPDGQLIAAGTMYGTINLWQLDGTLIRTLGEPRKVHPITLHFSPYGRARVATLSFSSYGSPLSPTQGYVLAVGFSKSEGFTQSDLLEFWEPSGTLVKQLEIADIDTTHEISFSPDGNTISLCTNGGTGIIQLRE